MKTPLEKKQKSHAHIPILIVGAIFLLYALVYFGSYLNTYISEGGSVVMRRAIEGLSSPFYFPGGVTLVLPAALLIMALIAILVINAWTKEKYQKGIAKAGTVGGTSRFQTPEDKEKFDRAYKDEDGNLNIRLSKNIYLSMDTRKTRRNLNIVIVGGSGTGKTRFVIKPQLIQAPLNTSFVVTDPSGDTLADTGKSLEKKGYKLKVFNLAEMSKSDTFNPFEYIYSEVDVILLVDCILKNTTDSTKTGGDDFWEKSQSLLLQSIIFLIWKYGDRLHLEKNMNTVLKLCSGFVISEDTTMASSQLGESSMYFEGACITGFYFDDDGNFHMATEESAKKAGFEWHAPAKAGKNDIAYRQYKDFIGGAAKTVKSVLMSIDSRFAVLKIAEVTELLRTDTIGIDKLGDEKIALFVIVPVENDSFNFIAAMFYTQMFQSLYHHASTKCTGSYTVYDANGEVVKTFFPAVKEEDTSDDLTVEDSIDFKKKKSTKINEKNIKIKKKKKKKNTQTEVKLEENWLAVNHENDGIEDEEVELPDTSKELEEVERFIKRVTDIKLSRIGRAYYIKLPATETEAEIIIGEYKDKKAAIRKCQAIVENCTYKQAKGPELPYNVRVLLDEFANTGQIPGFTKKLATMRKHKISSTIILQNISQIKNMYKDDWGSIMGNCDSFLFLGCPEYDTLEYVSKILGKKTQKQKNVSLSYGAKGNVSNSIQENGRDLMTPDELFRLDNKFLIYMLRGEHPILDEKSPYDETIPGFLDTADANSGNTYIVPVRKISSEPTDSTHAVQDKPVEALDVEESIDFQPVTNIDIETARTENEKDELLQMLKAPSKESEAMKESVVNIKSLIDTMSEEDYAKVIAEITEDDANEGSMSSESAVNLSTANPSETNVEDSIVSETIGL